MKADLIAAGRHSVQVMWGPAPPVPSHNNLPHSAPVALPALAVKGNELFSNEGTGQCVGGAGLNMQAGLMERGAHLFVSSSALSLGD